MHKSATVGEKIFYHSQEIPVFRGFWNFKVEFLRKSESKRPKSESKNFAALTPPALCPSGLQKKVRAVRAKMQFLFRLFCQVENAAIGNLRFYAVFSLFLLPYEQNVVILQIDKTKKR